MSDESKLYEELAAHFPPDQVKVLPPNAGSKAGLSYVPSHHVKDRLNRVFGPTGWSFMIDDVKVGKKVVWVQGEIVVNGAYHTGIGVADIEAKSRSNPDPNLDTALKAAVSDCIKICASQMGVALYLYSGDEGAAQPSSTVPPRRPRAQPSTFALDKTAPPAPFGDGPTPEWFDDVIPVKKKDGTTWAQLYHAGQPQLHHKSDLAWISGLPLNPQYGDTMQRRAALCLAWLKEALDGKATDPAARADKGGGRSGAYTPDAETVEEAVMHEPGEFWDDTEADDAPF